jgi:hypothetical protein
MARKLLIAFGILLAALLVLPLLCSQGLMYAESKGPFKNWTQVVDWEADGDLDVIVSHTRWEEVDVSWAGIGIWVNQGDGAFELLRDRGTETYPFGGFAAAGGDVDQDGDLDVFTQDFPIHLLIDQGGIQQGKPGAFKLSGGINTPPAYGSGYRDMGGSIVLDDLTGDGRIDAFVAGCCYGLNPRQKGESIPHAPSASWAWINDGRMKNLQTGHILPLDFLDGLPIRQAALGDLDGDGDLDVYAAVGKPTLGTVDSLDDRILLNDGKGQLAAYAQELGNIDTTSVALGDVNGDGRLDALVGTSSGARIWMNQGQAVGSGGALLAPTEQSFKPAQSIWGWLLTGYSATLERLFGIYLPYGSLRTKAVFLADLDGDGDLDALLARVWWAEAWWNAGQGEFRRSDVRFDFIQEQPGVALADFDGDGDEDILAGGNEDACLVWWNDGKGAFKTAGK